jgi:hypothetical protein
MRFQEAAMLPRFATSTLAAMLMLAPAAAFATATAHIAQGPITYTLVDLDKNDGITPWISFQPVPDGRAAHGGVAIARVFGGESDVSYGDDLGSGFLSMGFQGVHQRGAGELSGAAAAGSMLLEASAQTEAGGSAYSRMDVSVWSPTLQYLLSPNTGVLLRSNAQAEGSVSALDGVENSRAVSWLEIMIATSDGTTTFMTDGANSEASLDADYPLAYNEAQLVELEFENNSGVVASGYISAYAWAWTYAVAVPAPPVPEPSALLMLMPGLLLVGRALRLRPRAAPTPAPRG